MTIRQHYSTKASSLSLSLSLSLPLSHTHPHIMFPFGTKNTYERVITSCGREQKKRLVLWALTISLSIALFLLCLALTATKQEAAKHGTLASSDHHVVSRAAVTISGDVLSACKTTLYPNACETALGSFAASPVKSPEQMFDVSVQFAVGRARTARSEAYNLSLLTSSQKTSHKVPTGVDDCLELLDITLDQLNDVLSTSSSDHDVQTWLSAALTNQVTCSESLQNDKTSKGADALNAQVDSLSEFISNSLALYKTVKKKKKGFSSLIGAGNRKLLNQHDRFPSWFSAGDRRLLEASPESIRADAVVAKDGSGTHSSINEAIAFVALLASTSASGGGGGGGGRSVIYVKAGTYNEHINIPTKQKNVMLMGDGKGKSVIVGSRSAEDGWSTYASATVAAMGAGFIAKGLTIINNAGPAKHQAVALRVGADRSVVYDCSIQGYQDTLYTHSNRQFYSNNDIYGTVDFIFGNSAVVIQNCFIQPRRPGSSQKNSITAQGRTDPNQNTGISIHKCRIQGASDLGGTPTYLGRPWQKYSRTVFMGSYLDGSINSAGWEQWSGSFALSTLYYGEYGNTGPGASTSGRVQWGGVHPSMSASEASKFTVGDFIFGDSWLPGTGVSYTSGL